MSPVEQAEHHDQNFIGAMTLLADQAPAGSTARYGAIPVAITGLPGAFFNGAWVLEPPHPEDLRRALEHLAAAGLPFALHVRSDLADVIGAAPQLGLRDEGRLPCFAMEPGPIPPPIPGITIERADGARWDQFLDASAEGFGMPRTLAESLFSAGVQADRRLRAFVGIVDGRAVAAAASVRIRNTVGIYSVATIPEARGRGFGTALTWHALADADPGWEVAVLQASEMGRPIYERMGFTLVREFAELIGPASA
jgi:ribosomal protein S18 acetylase RimI-like enzyme